MPMPTAPRNSGSYVIDLTTILTNAAQQHISRRAERSVQPTRALPAGVALPSLEDQLERVTRDPPVIAKSGYDPFEGCAGENERSFDTRGHQKPFDPARAPGFQATRQYLDEPRSRALPEKLKGASHPPEARPGLSGSARAHVGLFFGTQISWRKTSMRYALVIIALTLSLVGCSKPKSGCAAHGSEASCTADKACNWNSDKNKCKKAEAAPKAEAPAPQAAPTPAPTPAPAPQTQPPAPSQPEQAPAEAPHPAPMAPPAPNNQ